VCKHREKALFWDSEHPTMAAWEYIVNLYATKPGFLLLADAPTLLQWWQNDAAIQEPVASPMPQPGMHMTKQ
jgi:aryl carrier-like protein